MNQKDLELQLEIYKNDLSAAITPLEYSFKKVEKSGLPDENDFELLETWESFSARFSRLSDIFLKKFLRASVMFEEPGFRGSLMDHLNIGEKLGLLSDANRWWVIRSIRNKVVHDYSFEELSEFLNEIYRQCSFLISEVRAAVEKL